MLTDCSAPRYINGVKNKMELLSKLNKPFSSTVIKCGLEYIKSKIKDTPFTKKFVNVYIPAVAKASDLKNNLISLKKFITRLIIT